MAANMADHLQILVDRGASDLHITSGTYPQVRISGRLTQLTQFEQLTPQDTQRLADRPKGLILVTGPTGSGKSTTLAAMIDKVNTERHDHIVTIEDPNEFVHPHKSCLVNQREVYSDTLSFQRALKSILRQDPDVVLVGEMRDLETISAALTIAETGHLTFATLHTNSCAQTMNRIIDVFPTTQQAQVRAQLALVVEGVLSQTLIPKVGGGRVMAMEIMVATPAIRNLIREEKIHQVYSAIGTGSKYGMQTMNQSLAELVKRKLNTREEGLNRSTIVEELLQLLGADGGAPAPAAPASGASPFAKR